MKKSIGSRRQQFAKNIRRTAIQKYKQQQRERLLNIFTPISDIAKVFELPEKEGGGSYTFSQILQARYKQFLHPPPPPPQYEIVSQDQPKQQLANTTSTQISLKDHILFWLNYSQALFQQKQTISPTLLKFILQYIKMNNHLSIHYDTKYQLYILNTLEVTSPHMQEQDKVKILEWVNGTMGFRVILACLPKQFLPVNCYRNIYDLIGLGLKSQLKRQCFQAAQILKHILLYSDWDDTNDIYRQYNNFIIYLQSKVRQYYKLEPIQIIIDCLIYLVDTYDSCILNYARAGTALSAAYLITSKIDANANKGLYLFKMMASVSKYEIISVLLEGEGIEESGAWDIMCCTTYFLKHHNQTIRETYASILNGIILNGNFDQIQMLGSKFKMEDMDLFYHIQQFLKEENPLIHKLMLQMIQSLMYYWNEEKSQDQPNCIEFLIQKHLYEHIKNLQDSDAPQIAPYAHKILDKLSAKTA